MPLRLTCKQANRGSVAVSARVPSKPGGRKRTLRLGNRSFFLGERRSATVKVRVARAAQRKLRRAGKRVRVKVTVRTRHRAGTPSTRLGSVVVKVR